MDAVGNGAQHRLVGERRGIATSLDFQFVRRHGKRNVDGQHQFDIDLFGSLSLGHQSKCQRRNGDGN